LISFARSLGDFGETILRAYCKDFWRQPWFVRNHGSRCWELDAMNPNVLRQRVRAAIMARIDHEAWEHCRNVEAADRESLASYIKARGIFCSKIVGRLRASSNFMPAIQAISEPRQLAFPFIEREPPPPTCSRSTQFYRAKIARAARQAYELGLRRRAPVQRAPRSLSAAAAPVRPLYPSRAEADELLTIAAQLSRLSISRRMLFLRGVPSSPISFGKSQIGDLMADRINCERATAPEDRRQHALSP
jgi:hypothetical protein